MIIRLWPFMLAFFIVALPMVLRTSLLGAPRSIEEGEVNAYGAAQAIGVQQQAVLTYCRASSCASGPVSQGNLTFKAPWSAPYGVSSCVGSTSLGQVAVSWDSSGRFVAGAVAADLGTLHAAASDTGVTGSQFINSPSGSIIPLPACAPVGVAAIADVVTP